ncbi:hypothetical protein [Bradyrhizobium sp. KBS0727]|uniref:hypothetical protein n=1 Tax=Bradyrhizobium sp. KBS0727 TaxID=2578114 RepID=UPI00143D0DF3|nr:hypothetical protein [Bradyrhizobium sp. KBS0727]
MAVVAGSVVAADFMVAACALAVSTEVACVQPTFGAALFMPDASMAVAAIASLVVHTPVIQ